MLAIFVDLTKGIYEINADELGRYGALPTAVTENNQIIISY